MSAAWDMSNEEEEEEVIIIRNKEIWYLQDMVFMDLGSVMRHEAEGTNEY